MTIPSEKVSWSDILATAIKNDDLIIAVEACKQIVAQAGFEYGRPGGIADLLLDVDLDASIYPTGEDRNLWNKAALVNKDEELARKFPKLLHTLSQHVQIISSMC